MVLMEGNFKMLINKNFFRAALLQPVPGGHVTITSQSSKIFQLLKSTNPMMQLLYASLVNHSLRYCDGTKMAASKYNYYTKLYSVL